MKLLARRARQQGEQARLAPRTLDVGHDCMIHLYRLLIRTYQHGGESWPARANLKRAGLGKRPPGHRMERTVRKLFDWLKVSSGIDDLCAHMLRHTWATNDHRSAPGSRSDLQTVGRRRITTHRVPRRHAREAATPDRSRVVQSCPRPRAPSPLALIHGHLGRCHFRQRHGR